MATLRGLFKKGSDLVDFNMILNLCAYISVILIVSIVRFGSANSQV